ncbi:hypothetical protein HYH03_005509 [Edaphochlamys debaryana]|uniref:Uncharacterized protein n=1 Tax=Edaphochlamys debaryana TaxID=47281 RepID=A0A835Y5B1_9CHLO|nr:hypothetical protein HYH03_005509 [Edaphochlamys debaryana]|eukprot:KAG2496276.1 hypothetical protein HYH03_005509 [Edaphochlamys debaryana]
MALCRELGVVVQPARLGRLRLVPLLAWHHKAFDEEPDIPGIPRATALTISDYARCTWPDRIPGDLQLLRSQQRSQQAQQAQHGASRAAAAASDSTAASSSSSAGAEGGGGPPPEWRAGGQGSCAVAEWFDRLNDLPYDTPYDQPLPRHVQPPPDQPHPNSPNGSGGDTRSGAASSQGGAGHSSGAGAAEHVISFSHFLPFQELLPEKRYLTFPNLAKAVGSTYLGRRLRRLRPDLHIFGHTHFAWDLHVDGIRCLQAPLAYPSERRFRLRSLVLKAEAVLEEEAQRATATASAAAGSSGSAAGPSSAGGRGGATARDTPAPAPPHPREQQQAAEAAAARVATAEPPPSMGSGSPEPGGAGCGEQVWDEEAEAAVGLAAPWPSGSDPYESRWLPVCVYRAAYRVRMGPDHMGPDHAGSSWPVFTNSSDGSSGPGGRGGGGGGRDAGQGLAAADLLQLEGCGGGGGGGQAGPAEVESWEAQWCPQQQAMWSSYYERTPRRPSDVTLAPWVAERYSRRRRRHIAQQSAALGLSGGGAAAAGAGATQAEPDVEGVDEEARTERDSSGDEEGRDGGATETEEPGGVEEEAGAVGSAGERRAGAAV